MTADWWQQASAAALLGTTRREPPAIPVGLGIAPRPDPTPETTLLDAAAVGGALLRATAHPFPVRETPPPTLPETAPVAPPTAVQLLGLLLDQPPVSARLRAQALGWWLHTCAQRGARVPHDLLPRLLDRATSDTPLRAATRPVLGERGHWLAALRSDWAWVLDRPDTPTGAPSSDFDADAWRLLPANDRATALTTLTTPLAQATIALLEEALDDRSEKVRRQACLALDGVPGSERAARMAARLRPLVAMTGRLRRGLEVTLPTTPDAAGIRDGLTTTRTGSQRERWLELICAGAPLSVWTDVSGKDAAHTWAMVTEPAAREGILRAIRVRHDDVWAEAVVASDPALLAILPPERRDATAVQLLRDSRAPTLVAAVIASVPAPWSAPLSNAVVDLLRHTKPVAGAGAGWLGPLAAGLHPTVRPQLSVWARSDHTWGSLPADLDQYLSFLPAITEAFR
ncbi:DUF5691 domain-containing protein [Nocardioides sp. WS12]|uniref:DUF5691 domain-containing protein n=1 Tax=Nocardioides sp. WS12 TaxID=2486272 RepID=UPI0015FE602B|nr:DUF5691 domain-containing protein [Nocardioides sp. WS12]